MSLQYYDSDNEALIPVAGNVNPSDVIELKTTKADKTQISNPNLLDNPWFTVNQRGFTSETGINKITVDRWYTILSANLTANANKSLTIEGTGDYGSCLCQKIESTLGERLKGKTVTFSVLLSNGTIYSATDTLPTTYPSSDKQYCSLNALIPNAFASGVYWSAGQSCLVAQVGQTTGNSCTIVAMKLELGSVSTLAMDTIPNYQQELAKCQRYFQNMNINGLQYASIGTGKTIGTTALYIDVPLCVPMRATPTLSLSGTIRCHGNGSIITQSTYTPATEQLFSNLVKISLKSLGTALTDHTVYMVDFADNVGVLRLTADL